MIGVRDFGDLAVEGVRDFIEYGPVVLSDAVNQGFADVIQTPEGIASFAGSVSGGAAGGLLGAKTGAAFGAGLNAPMNAPRGGAGGSGLGTGLNSGSSGVAALNQAPSWATSRGIPVPAVSNAGAVSAGIVSEAAIAVEGGGSGGERRNSTDQDSNADSQPKIDIPDDLTDFQVPSVRNGEFNRWFDDLTSEQFNRLWSDLRVRRMIEDRIRQPRGYHEWHLVARTPRFKEWGISMDDIKGMRTLINDVEFRNPWGIHGGTGSTAAHNQILRIIDTSTGYDQFVVRLNNWASDRLVNGRQGLPEGFRR